MVWKLIGKVFYVIVIFKFKCKYMFTSLCLKRNVSIFDLKVKVILIEILWYRFTLTLTHILFVLIYMLTCTMLVHRIRFKLRYIVLNSIRVLRLFFLIISIMFSIVIFSIQTLIHTLWWWLIWHQKPSSHVVFIYVGIVCYANKYKVFEHLLCIVRMHLLYTLIENVSNRLEI